MDATPGEIAVISLFLTPNMSGQRTICILALALAGGAGATVSEAKHNDMMAASGLRAGTALKCESALAGYLIRPHRIVDHPRVVQRTGDSGHGAVDMGAVDMGVVDMGAVDMGAVDMGAVGSVQRAAPRPTHENPSKPAPHARHH